MVVIVFVELGVQLCQKMLEKPNKYSFASLPCVPTNQIEHGNFHHTLIEVRRAVLDDLYCNDFLRPQVLTLDYLAKRALPQHIEDEIAVSVTQSQHILPTRKEGTDVR